MRPPKFQPPKPKVPAKAPIKAAEPVKMPEKRGGEASNKAKAEDHVGKHAEAKDIPPSKQATEEDKKYHPVRKVGQFPVDRENSLEIFARVVPTRKIKPSNDMSRKPQQDDEPKSEVKAAAEENSQASGSRKPAEPAEPPKKEARTGLFFPTASPSTDHKPPFP